MTATQHRAVEATGGGAEPTGGDPLVHAPLAHLLAARAAATASATQVGGATSAAAPPAVPLAAPPTLPPTASPAAPPPLAPQSAPAPSGPPAQAARPPQSESSAWLSSITTMVAIVSLWTLAQLLVLGGIAHSRDQSLLYDRFRTDVASGIAPLGPAEPGTPVALLEIPAIGVDEVVVEGTSSGDTLAGPGHQSNTPLPGQAGLSFIDGRGSTYGGPFGDIGDLKPGDRFTTTTGQGSSSFTVLDVRRPGDPQPQPMAAGAARLTLVSAEGSGFLGSLRPGTAVYVDADADKAMSTPPGRSTALPEAERVMSGDSSVLPLLTLYLALLVALTLGVVAARRRWSRVLVWTVAGPVVIALAWATTDVGVRLLPNVM